MTAQIERHYIEDLKIGQSASYTRTITEADVQQFGAVSGDLNPLHFDEDYAKTTIFRGRIAHGMLSLSFVSTVLGTQLPGAGSIFMSSTVRFKAPVRIGDTVVARVELTSLVPEKNFAVFKTQCLVGQKVVIDGEATILIPSRGK